MITDGHVTIWSSDHLSDQITDADEACREIVLLMLHNNCSLTTFLTGSLVLSNIMTFRELQQLLFYDCLETTEKSNIDLE